jgi:hypothetical protein
MTSGMPSCTNLQLGSARDLRQRDRRRHVPGRFGSSNAIGVADALARFELEVLAAKRVALARREVRERHLVGAAHLRIDLVDLAGETVWRQPLGHGVRIEEGAVDPLTAFARSTR